MREELLRCWCCNQTPEAEHNSRECKTKGCPNFQVMYSEARWNERALPAHELRQRAEKAEAKAQELGQYLLINSEIVERTKAEVERLREALAEIMEIDSGHLSYRIARRALAGGEK